MKPEELIIYEMPTIAEYISNNFLQGIIGRLIASKVNRKTKRYKRRQKMEERLKNRRNNQ